MLRHPVAGAEIVASRFDHDPVGNIYRSMAPFAQQRCRIKWIDASSNITRADARRLRLITWIDFQSVYFDDDVDRDVALALFG